MEILTSLLKEILQAPPLTLIVYPVTYKSTQNTDLSPVKPLSTGEEYSFFQNNRIQVLMLIKPNLSKL
jgi:hypothetical protein